MIYNIGKKRQGGKKMSVTLGKIRILSSNTLKIIAAISMLLDHIGVIFFPKLVIFRILGRFAFPIFAFMIAEGCKHTKHRLRYFLTVLLMGVAYFIVYYVYSSQMYFCILITFACSIAMIFALQEFKKSLVDENAGVIKMLLTGFGFLAVVGGVFAFTYFFKVDYGFIGCVIPVLVSLCHAPRDNAPALWKKLDCLPLSLFGLTVGLIIYIVTYGDFRIYSLLAIPLLMLYSGKRGRLKMKYFFYIFYPAHLLLLEGIAMLLTLL